MARRHRPTQQTPDLFEAAALHGPRLEPTPAANGPVPERRYILPRDLPAALTRLTNEELKALGKAVAGEFHRRGLTAAEKAAKPLPQPTSFLKAGEKRQVAAKTAKLEPPALTHSQFNAIRAAFTAGVKPTMIARQFGVSQVAIRRALSDKKE